MTTGICRVKRAGNRGGLEYSPHLAPQPVYTRLPFSRRMSSSRSASATSKATSVVGVKVTRALVENISIRGYIVGNVLVEFRYTTQVTEVPDVMEENIVTQSIVSASMVIENFGRSEEEVVAAADGGKASSRVSQSLPKPVSIKIAPVLGKDRGEMETSDRIVRPISPSLAFDVYYPQSSPHLPISADLDSAFGIDVTTKNGTVGLENRVVLQSMRLVNAVFQHVIQDRLRTIASQLLAGKEGGGDRKSFVKFRNQLRMMAGCIVFMNLLSKSRVAKTAGGGAAAAAMTTFRPNLIGQINVLSDFNVHAMVNERFGYRDDTRRPVYNPLSERMKTTGLSFGAMDLLPTEAQWTDFVSNGPRKFLFLTMQTMTMQNTFNMGMSIALVQCFPSFVISSWKNVADIYPSAADFVDICDKTCFEALCPLLPSTLDDSRALGMFMTIDQVEGVTLTFGLSRAIKAWRNSANTRSAEDVSRLWMIADLLQYDKRFVASATDDQIQNKSYTFDMEGTQHVINRKIEILKQRVDELEEQGRANVKSIARIRTSVFFFNQGQPKPSARISAATSSFASGGSSRTFSSPSSYSKDNAPLYAMAMKDIASVLAARKGPLSLVRHQMVSVKALMRSARALDEW